MSAAHTPGPWVADAVNAWPEQIGCCPLVGRPYSISHNSINVAAATTPANAQLIAAAPDLLEAAKDLKEVCNRPSAARTRAYAWKALDKAIAKAEGR